jgi:hypothetical protein
MLNEDYRDMLHALSVEGRTGGDIVQSINFRLCKSFDNFEQHPENLALFGVKAMDKKEYHYQQMLYEYDTLRSEILQIYEQQTSLVFSGTIIIAASLLATLVQSSANLLVLPALLIVLIGICSKSIANYTRIFRNGAYLSVVHEQSGQSTRIFNPGPERAAWHSRWRQLAECRTFRNIGAEAPRAEALFLVSLGIAGWVLAWKTVREQLFFETINDVVYIASVVLTAFFLCRLYRLGNVVKVSEQYERAFRCQLKKKGH